MKPLDPSIREKKRYFLIEGKNLKENVERAILDFIGILGMAKTGLNWIKVFKESAIISVNREMGDYVKASLIIWPEKIEVRKISGTLKGLKSN